MGTELADLSPEFVPELDRFLPRDEITQQDYFVESQKRVEKFKETLALFQKNLVDRKVDRRYEIAIKDANSYTLQDVLQIAKIVQKKHSDADQVHSCMGRLKKFFHATGRNASTFKRLLAFVPDDVYGSVICGGFTVILGVCIGLLYYRLWQWLGTNVILDTRTAGNFAHRYVHGARQDSRDSQSSA